MYHEGCRVKVNDNGPLTLQPTASGNDDGRRLLFSIKTACCVKLPLMKLRAHTIGSLPRRQKCLWLFSFFFVRLLRVSKLRKVRTWRGHRGIIRYI